jgi:hypothetical protein
MLARLRMSVEEVIEEFSIIIERVHKLHSLDRRRARLKTCLKDMFTKKEWDDGIRLEDGWQDDHCAGFAIVPMPGSWLLTESIRFALGVEPGTCFRSYPLLGWSSNTRVIDAMLDTCTPNTTFVPTDSTTARNHLLEFVSEARSLYGGEAFVLSLLSLGSGHFGITHIMLQNNDTIANNTVLEILPNSEVLAKKMERRMKDIGVYFRFSIEHGMQKNEPSYDDDLVSINALALSYLDDEEVRNTAACYVESFVDRPGWINLDTLGTPVILKRN